MAKSEKRSGFFGLFSRRSAVSEKDLMTRESGPSDVKDANVLKSFSAKWYGSPEAQIEEPQKSLKQAVEGDDAAAVNEAVEVAPGDDAPAQAIEGGDDLEEVSRSIVGLLTKIGVPVAVAAAACAVLCKVLS